MKRLRFIFTVGLIVIASVAVLASGEEQKAEKVGSSDSSSSSKSEVFAIGDDVKIGDWQLKAHAFTDPVPAKDDFSKPEAGKRWVGVDLEVKNTGDDAETVSSIICYELKDSENKTYDASLFGSDNVPEGNLNAGESKRGVIVFEVPEGASGFTFSFSCDIGSSGSAQIKVS